MASRACLFALILLSPVWLFREENAQFILWNVGQGLWTTAVVEHRCLHFDMGGERSPWKQVMALCRDRENLLHISHWDQDHLNFTGKAAYFLPAICRMNLPPNARSEKTRAKLLRFEHCPQAPKSFSDWSPTGKASSNGSSVVALWRDILIPGDSDSSQEKIWAYQMHGLSQVRVLVLGHHGSRTSTSDRLLAQLTNVRLAIASARRRRYGHPHTKVVDRLRDLKVPVLSTEDWGNIHIWE